MNAKSVNPPARCKTDDRVSPWWMGYLPGKAYLAREFDDAGFDPLRNGLDDQDVIRFELQIGARIAAANQPRDQPVSARSGARLHLGPHSG